MKIAGPAEPFNMKTTCMTKNLYRHSLPATPVLLESSTQSTLFQHAHHHLLMTSHLVSHWLSSASISTSSLPCSCSVPCARLGDNVRLPDDARPARLLGSLRESVRGPRCYRDIGNGSHCAGSNQERLSSSISDGWVFFPPRRMGLEIFFQI